MFHSSDISSEALLQVLRPPINPPGPNVAIHRASTPMHLLPIPAPIETNRPEPILWEGTAHHLITVLHTSNGNPGTEGNTKPLGPVTEGGVHPGIAGQDGTEPMLLHQAQALWGKLSPEGTSWLLLPTGRASGLYRASPWVEPQSRSLLQKNKKQKKGPGIWVGGGVVLCLHSVCTRLKVLVVPFSSQHWVNHACLPSFPPAQTRGIQATIVGILHLISDHTRK